MNRRRTYRRPPIAQRVDPFKVAWVAGMCFMAVGYAVVLFVLIRAVS